ncbi:MAG: histone deacetylase [Phycisphaerae bacterium]|nr:histone deacetylase [Phycisphaerae bacterium]
MRVSYHPDYVVELPEGHPFPMRKFSELARIVVAEGIAKPHEVLAPDEASWDTLGLVHTSRYLNALRDGTLAREEERRLGLPWSRALARRSRLATQGTINAARWALDDGVAGNLAGGTHHAHPDGGEGFCVINDVAVAVRQLQREGRARRCLLVDLDVHHGNGNAAYFAGDEDVFTFSMHGAKNFPLRKPPSDLDVPLDDHTGDIDYQTLLERWLPVAIERARADLVFYLAGVDVVVGDRYGRLALTRAGLRRRDEFVLASLFDKQLPVCVVLSGGYARTAELTAELHADAFRAAACLLTSRDHFGKSSVKFSRSPHSGPPSGVVAQ